MSLVFLFVTHNIKDDLVLTGDGHYALLIRSRVFTREEEPAIEIALLTIPRVAIRLALGTSDH